MKNIELAARLKEMCKPFDLEFTGNGCQLNILTAYLPIMTRVKVPIAFDRTEVIRLSDDRLKKLAQGRIKHTMLDLIGCANDVIEKTQGDQSLWKRRVDEAAELVSRLEDEIAVLKTTNENLIMRLDDIEEARG